MKNKKKRKNKKKNEEEEGEGPTSLSILSLTPPLPGWVDWQHRHGILGVWQKVPQDDGGGAGGNLLL